MKIIQVAPMWKYTMVADGAFWAIILIVGGHRGFASNGWGVDP